MVAEKLGTELKAELAKFALGLKAGGLESERIARSHLIDQKGEMVRGVPRAGAQDEATGSLGVLIDVADSSSGPTHRGPHNRPIGLRSPVDKSRNHRSRPEQPGHGFC